MKRREAIEILSSLVEAFDSETPQRNAILYAIRFLKSDAVESGITVNHKITERQKCKVLGMAFNTFLNHDYDEDMIFGAKSSLGHARNLTCLLAVEFGWVNAVSKLLDIMQYSAEQAAKRAVRNNKIHPIMAKLYLKAKRDCAEYSVFVE